MAGFLSWIFKVSKLILVKVTVIKIGDDGKPRILESQFCTCDDSMVCAAPNTFSCAMTDVFSSTRDWWMTWVSIHCSYVTEYKAKLLSTKSWVEFTSPCCALVRSFKGI